MCKHTFRVHVEILPVIPLQNRQTYLPLRGSTNVLLNTSLYTETRIRNLPRYFLFAEEDQLNNLSSKETLNPSVLNHLPELLILYFVV